MDSRKILITNGMSSDCIIIITDAPKEAIEKWLIQCNEDSENGEGMLFDMLKSQEYYVRLLHDSEVHCDEDVEIIGYDEVYNLSDYCED